MTLEGNQTRKACKLDFRRVLSAVSRYEILHSAHCSSHLIPSLRSTTYIVSRNVDMKSNCHRVCNEAESIFEQGLCPDYNDFRNNFRKKRLTTKQCNRVRVASPIFLDGFGYHDYILVWTASHRLNTKPGTRLKLDPELRHTAIDIYGMK